MALDSGWGLGGGDTTPLPTNKCSLFVVESTDNILAQNDVSKQANYVTRMYGCQISVFHGDTHIHTRTHTHTHRKGRTERSPNIAAVRTML